MKNTPKIRDLEWDEVVPFVKELAEAGKLKKGQPTAEMQKIIMRAMRRSRVKYRGKVFTWAELFAPLFLDPPNCIPDYVLSDARCLLYGMPCSTEEYQELQQDPLLYTWVAGSWKIHYEHLYEEAGDSLFYQRLHGFCKDCRAEGLIPYVVCPRVPRDVWSVEIIQWALLESPKPVVNRAAKAKAMAWGQRWGKKHGYQWNFGAAHWEAFAACDLPVRKYRRLVVAYNITKDWEMAVEFAQRPFKECVSLAEAYAVLAR
jgi:hypothetical protein